METLIVTRHPALITFLVDKGLATKETPVIAHATPENVIGKHVIGVLPHHLSALSARYTEVTIIVPPELRGVELTKEQLDQYTTGYATYIVTLRTIVKY